jgi:hypothetical protein
MLLQKGRITKQNGKCKQKGAKIGESQKSFLNILNLTIRIGCWNVRTLWETGKMREATAEMKIYKIEILGISETHWTGFGEVNIQRDETFVYSGTEKEYRVGLLLPKRAKRSLLKWN